MHDIKGISIRVKLMAGFAVILFGMIVLGWRGAAGMREINLEFNAIKADQLTPSRVVAQANIRLIAWNRAILNHVLAENIQKMDQYKRIMLKQKAAVHKLIHQLCKIENLSEN
jgi:hypothetical protein